MSLRHLQLSLSLGLYAVDGLLIAVEDGREERLWARLWERLWREIGSN